MLYVQPDFYDDFQCIAEKCRHSCCRGWEIDIDPDSMERFAKVGGELGQSLKDNIAAEPSPHFILGEDERCPFLEESGLCRLILDLGEESLCDICAEHPRFYNEYPGRLEIGLGLCCEEVVRLLCSGSELLRFEVWDDGEEIESGENEYIRLRDRIFSVLEDESISMTERMKRATAILGGTLPDFHAAEFAAFLLGLERMDEDWTKLLQMMQAGGNTVHLEPELSRTMYEHIAACFVYRHFAEAENRAEAIQRLIFAFFSTMTVCCLNVLCPGCDALRLYSAEIEYSDENVDKILRNFAG